MNTKTSLTFLAILCIVLAGCQAATTTEQESKDMDLNDAEPQAKLPGNCIAWFDGCNNCVASEGGAACTRKYCAPEMMEPPQCLEYAQE